MGARKLLGRTMAVIKGVICRLRPGRTRVPAPKPRPPLAKAEPIPADPAEHAKDFGSRYYEPIERCVQERMRQVGVPEDQIGVIDPGCHYRLAAFHPLETDGG